MWTAQHFYDALKTVYRPQPSGSSPLLSADETQLLTEKKQILEKWAEHFDQHLNHPAKINDKPTLSAYVKWRTIGILTSCPQKKSKRHNPC